MTQQLGLPVCTCGRPVIGFRDTDEPEFIFTLRHRGLDQGFDVRTSNPDLEAQIAVFLRRAHLGAFQVRGH